MQLSVPKYAKRIKVSRQAVLLQIKESRLAKGVTATKIGRQWVISIPD